MRCRGFTLIELAVALVIIGLIVGGVLVGRDLVGAAAVRSQVTQIEKLNSAVNTFKSKFNGYLPGDIPEPYASQFGFKPRTACGGGGDGNGVITGMNGSCGPLGGGGTIAEVYGETTVFWVDLSTANLIDGKFVTALTSGAATTMPTVGSGIDLYFPQAKIGRGNYLYVWSGGIFNAYSGALNPGTPDNYYGLSAVTMLGAGSSPWPLSSKTGLTVREAYDIDKKIDDGLPQSGNVISYYIAYDIANYRPVWAAGGSTEGARAAHPDYGPTTNAIAGSSITCYDNNNTGGATQQYSLTQNSGAGTNCALSFRFQ